MDTAVLPAACQALSASESAAKPQESSAHPACDSTESLQVTDQLHSQAAQHAFLPADGPCAEHSIDVGGPESPPVTDRAPVNCYTSSSARSLEDAMPPERTPALDAALPHAASSAAEGRLQAMRCEGCATDAASEQALRQAATGGGAVSVSIGVSHPGGESHGTGSSVRSSSPFARASWQQGTHPGSCQPQAPPQQQQQQHVHWGSGSVPGTGSASLPPGPAVQQPEPVGSNQQPAGAGSNHDADRRTSNMPAQSLPAAQAPDAPAQPECSAAARLPLPAKPPSGRPVRSHALAGAASGASLASSRGSLDGALGAPCSSMHSHGRDHPSPSGASALRRLSDSSVGSDASGSVAGYTSRGRLGRAVYIAEDEPASSNTNGIADINSSGAGINRSGEHGDTGHPAAASAHAANRAARRLPSSVPHSPRRPRSSWDGGPSLQGAQPRRRQHSWDGGASPLGVPGGALLGLAHGYAPGMWTAALGGTAAHPSAGAALAAASIAAAQPPEEPQFFDPSAHAMRLRAERSGGPGAAEPTPERRGEPPAWRSAPQRAASSASVLPYPTAAAAAAEAEAAKAAEAAHLARERRWRQQRQKLELSHARKRDKAKAAQQAAQAAAAREASRQRGAAAAAALFALGAVAGLQLAAQQQRRTQLQGDGAGAADADSAAGAAREDAAAAAETADVGIAMQRLGSAQLQPHAPGSPLRRVSFQKEMAVPVAGSSPPTPTRLGSRGFRAIGSHDFAAAKASSRVALRAVRSGFERSGAAKLHLEGVARQPQGGAPPAGQPSAVVALALKRITHLRQAVFKAHYQYLLFLRNSFDKAAGAGTTGRRLADAMCQESRSLHRVLDIEVRETKVVCMGWSDRLAWMEGGDGKPDVDEALRHVLMSAHGRLEGINAPFIQAVAALEDIFRDAAPQGGLSHSSSAELLAPKSPTRSALLSAYASPDGSPRSSPSRRPALRQRSSSGSLNALLQLQPASPPRPAPLQPHTSVNGLAAPTANQHGDKPGVIFAAPSTPSAVLQQLPAALSGEFSGASYRPAAALSTPQHPASGSPTAASTRPGIAAAVPPQQSEDGPAPGQFVLDTWSSGQLVAGADAEADLQSQLMASLRQLDEARTNLAGRDTELKAMRARVALQTSYIEKLEDEQSGFAGGSGYPSPALSSGPSGDLGNASPEARPTADTSNRTALSSSRLTSAAWDARLAWT